MTTPRTAALRTALWRWVRRLLAVGLTAAALWGGYLGYCWGWWLRDNLLAQSLFQCNCPAASEAVRYAPFRLVASACSDPWVRVSPSGTHLLITERAARPPVTVLVDVVTGERTIVSFADARTVFVTDTLVLTQQTNSALLDLANPTSVRRPVQEYGWWDETTARQDEAGILYLLRDTDQMVFVPTVPGVPGFVVNHIAPPSSIAQWATPPTRTIVTMMGHRRLTPAHAMWNVDGRGIFDRTSHMLLVPTERQATDWPLRPWMHPLPFQPVGWLESDRSVIYQFCPVRPFVIDFGNGAPYGRLGLIAVPQPILALDVPEELLRATPTP